MSVLSNCHLAFTWNVCQITLDLSQKDWFLVLSVEAIKSFKSLAVWNSSWLSHHCSSILLSYQIKWKMLFNHVHLVEMICWIMSSGKNLFFVCTEKETDFGILFKSDIYRVCGVRCWNLSHEVVNTSNVVIQTEVYHFRRY